MEARAGIEPACADLQSATSPLRHRASCQIAASPLGWAGCWTAMLVSGFRRLVKESPEWRRAGAAGRTMRGWRHPRCQLCAATRGGMAVLPLQYSMASAKAAPQRFMFQGIGKG